MQPFQTLLAYPVKLRDSFTLSPIALSAWILVFLFATANHTFWMIGAEVFFGHGLAFSGFVLALFLLMLSIFSLFGFPWVLKPFLVVIVVLSAVSSYYVDTLGIVVDRDMIQNVAVTTFAESKHLITLGFVLHLVVFGLVPAAIILTIRPKPQGMLRTLATPLVGFVVGMSLAVGVLALDMKSYAAVVRERKDLLSSFQPGAPLLGIVRYARMVSKVRKDVIAPIGEDAVKGSSYGAGANPVLAVVVVGETARSQNFSLNGYNVKTNPRLADLPVVSFSNVHSCGTATAVSLPCMFSSFGRGRYTYERGVSTENVLDVFKHAGFHLEWWDNNTGHKGAADRIESKSFVSMSVPEFCGQGECTDGVFLGALQNYAETIVQDTVLVLHQIGSHGPAYYLRYPAAFERFTPSCRTAEFMNCTPEEIVNSYDNTIAYTDEFLAEAIGVLNRQSRADTVLMYVSDHGESLGEGGLFLHGAPYFMAPEYQTKVPMIVWLSDRFSQRFSIDKSCLADQRDTELSHDNLFHSLLGMLDVSTDVRDAGLDIFARCMKDDKVASR